MTITARTGEGEISALIVPNGTPGYTISAPMQKLGWRASDTRELSFQGARVPEGNLLGPRGAGLRQFLQILDGGRISVAAMGVGLAQGCYDLASRTRRSGSSSARPIASFQAVQQKLVDMATEIEAARHLVYKAAWEKDQGRDFARTAAMAKLFSGELSHRAANWALQIHGGYGFMDEYPISRLYRDQKILEIGEGTNEVQRMVIARHLGLPASRLLSCCSGSSSTTISAAARTSSAMPRPAKRSSSIPPSRSSSTSRRRKQGVRIVRVLETHTHADHLSGHGRFALEHGVPVSIHPLARPEYPFEPLEDGDAARRRRSRSASSTRRGTGPSIARSSPATSSS